MIYNIIKGVPPVLFAFVMLILCSTTIRAQDTLRISSKAKLVEGGIIQDRNDNRDVNGVLTAGLLINSDLTGFSFTSNNGIHKILPQPGANLLYLSPDERVVTIFREGFVKFQLVLSDEGINLESGKVWEITITGDKQLQNAAVRFTINTENATILIDGEEHQVEGTVFDTNLAEGDHNIQVLKNTFKPVQDSINVVIGSVNIFNFELESTPLLFMRVASVPTGALVFIDDSPSSSGTTDFTARVYPGLHRFRLVKDGYVTLEDEVQITPEMVKNGLTYNLQESAGYLTVNTTPENARIVVDGEVKPSKADIKLDPGPHQLEVVAPGYDSQTKNIEIALGDTLREEFTLNLITGNLIFSIMQPEAEIELRKGNEVVESWKGSRYLQDYPVGKYTLRASLNNFETQTHEIEILRDRDVDLDLDLTQISGKGSLSIDGVFSDATVEIKGTRYNRTFNSMPINIPTLDWGAYDITISKDGFVTHTERKVINSFQDSIVFIDEFVPKTKGKAFIRSLFIPGLGHGYLDKGGRGFLYFLGSAAAIGFTYKSYMDYNKNSQAYFDAVQRYKSAGLGSNFPQLKADYTEAHASAIKAKDNIKLGIMIFGAVKGLETLDLLLSRSNKKMLRNAKLNFDPNTNGISMKVDF